MSGSPIPEVAGGCLSLLLLVRNRKGYQQLCELLTKAYLVEGRRDRAEIRREVVCRDRLRWP